MRRAVLLTLSLPVLGGCRWLSDVAAREQYHRVVVLSDCHLPFRSQHHKTAEQQQRILAIKSTVRKDINSWPDVELVAVTGDIAARWAIPEEVEYAQGYFSAFRAPVKLVAGNHDYIYTGELNEKGKNVWADKDGRRWRLAKFCQDWGLASPSYSLKLGCYRLYFLSPEALEPKYMTCLSKKQLGWLEQELKQYSSEPGIIFFHAPLQGTLEQYESFVNSPQMVAQPQQAIDALLKKNPQVFLWVSGHTHTSPEKSKSFADLSVNLYDGRVMNIHCDTMDRKRNISNSLYLYEDRVEIRTYDHLQGKWRGELDRVVYVPKP